MLSTSAHVPFDNGTKSLCLFSGLCSRQIFCSHTASGELSRVITIHLPGLQYPFKIKINFLKYHHELHCMEISICKCERICILKMTYLCINWIALLCFIVVHQNSIGCEVAVTLSIPCFVNWVQLHVFSANCFLPFVIASSYRRVRVVIKYIGFVI